MFPVIYKVVVPPKIPLKYRKRVRGSAVENGWYLKTQYQLLLVYFALCKENGSYVRMYVRIVYHRYTIATDLSEVLSPPLTS